MKIPPPAPAPNLSEILAFAFWMQKQGYRPSTIQAAVSTLKAVAKKVILLNQDAVKAHLASRNVSVGRKEKICQYLARFYKFKQIPFQMPRYHRNDSIPFVPQEKEVDQLISACGKKTATFLQLLKETGIRPGEAWALRWKDVDFGRAAVTITPEKGSNARQLKISSHLIAMLNALPHPYEYCFRNPEIDHEKSMRTYQKVFEEQRELHLQSCRHERGTNLPDRSRIHTCRQGWRRMVLPEPKVRGCGSIKHSLDYGKSVKLMTKLNEMMHICFKVRGTTYVSQETLNLRTALSDLYNYYLYEPLDATRDTAPSLVNLLLQQQDPP